MDFATLVRSRRTVHNYKPQKVDDKLVEEALSLSLWAPNHKLTYPWVFYSVGPEVRAKLADLSAELKAGGEPLSDVKRQALRAKVLRPSHYILLGVKRSDPKREHEDYATLACSVQIASMHLWEHGLGTKWTTGGVTYHPKTYELIGVSPEAVRLEGALLVGIPDGVKPPVPERPPLSQFLRKTT